MKTIVRYLGESKVRLLIMVLLLVFIFFFLNLSSVFFSNTTNLHFIRQTDSLSFVAQYYDGSNFFSPGLYNLTAQDGKAACEFPIYYYVTAKLYSLFGEHLFILKILNFTTLYVGMIYLFKVNYLIIKDFTYAILLTFFLFTSTVFNYYSLNYLPDIPALGLLFIGAFHVVKGFKENSKKNIIYGFVFFSLATLIKATFLILPLTTLIFAGYMFIKKDKSFSKNTLITVFAGGFVMLCLVFTWNSYMIHYNLLNHTSYFTTSARPLWGLSAADLAFTWDLILNHWYTKYFAASSFHLLYAVFLFQILLIFKANIKQTILLAVAFLGTLSFIILFFAQFRDHDYYFLTLIPFISFLLLNGILLFKSIFKSIKFEIALKIILTILIITGVNYSRMKLEGRLIYSQDDFTATSMLIEANSSEIENLKIDKNATFIVAPEIGPNGALLFLDRKGWNISDEKDITIEAIDKYKKLGADYFLLNSSSDSISKIVLEEGNLIFENGNLKIYNLK